MSPARSFGEDVASGERFRFGENWKQFLQVLDDDRIREAERSLSEMLNLERLDGKTFLDIGSGSGLFSLAARNLGASVFSFDYDPTSVWCAQELKNRFHRDDPRWQISQGSVLDAEFMSRLPSTVDIVYSWGVLHHTGRMYEAIEAAAKKVAPGGKFYVAVYRKTWFCWLWRLEKKLYSSSGRTVQWAIRSLYRCTVGVAYRVRHSGKATRRGMDWQYDLHDWLGGYPYESVTPRKIKRFIHERGFTTARQVVKSEGVHITPGCDEFIFEKMPSTKAPRPG